VIISSFTIEHWHVLISLISLVVVVIGIIIAVKNLKIIAKSQRLEVIDKFINELQSNEVARKFLFKEFRFVSIDSMDEKSICEVEKVINSLNRICLLIDNKLIDAEIIFGLCHTMIVRCEYQLREYIRQKEESIGGRYGRRITKLTERAKKFHDSYKNHRCNPIKINKVGFDSIIIYTTFIGNSFEEKLNNQLEWLWRRLWKLF
jgi:hypothetical protein